MPNLIGQTLQNQYRVDSFIASGGMGAVYRVTDLKSNRALAMKVLHSDLTDDPIVFKRFQREADALQRLRHDNIVPFYGMFEERGLSCLLEEYIIGSSLQEILRERNGQPVPVNETLAYMKGLCSALYFAHTNNVVHCDIKPGNVLVNRAGKIFLADFGIAKFTNASTTTTVGMAGTPAYMAPEQIMGKGVTPLTDIYALGVMLFEMLAGQRPFRGTEAESESIGSSPSDRIRFAHVRLPPPDPREINPNLSEPLARVILRGLAKNPAERFRNTGELFLALCQAAQMQPNQVADETTLTGTFIPLPMPPASAAQRTSNTPSGSSPSQNVLSTPRPRKKQNELSPSQMGIIGLLGIGVMLALFFGISALTQLPFMQAATGTPTNSPVPSATLTPLPPTVTFTPSTTPTTGPTRTPIAPPDTATPFKLPTATPTKTDTPVPTNTSAAPPPTAAPTKISQPSGAAFNPPCSSTHETLTANFSGGRQAVFTTNSYSGNVDLIVSGYGQAEGKNWTDAFYMFKDKAGNPLTPSHPNGGIFTINKLIVDKFIDPPPAYNASHVYQFLVVTTSGNMSFGVMDQNLTDNKGSYTVSVCQR